MDETTVNLDLSCQFHPTSKEAADFYLYKNKKPLCKACVKKRHTDWYQKHKAGKSTSDKEESTSTTFVRSSHHDPAKITKHNFMKKPDEPEHPDAWGPYAGESAETIQRRKRMRGTAFCSSAAWRSKEEVELAEKQSPESQWTQDLASSQNDY